MRSRSRNMSLAPADSCGRRRVQGAPSSTARHSLGTLKPPSNGDSYLVNLAAQLPQERLHERLTERPLRLVRLIHRRPAPPTPPSASPPNRRHPPSNIPVAASGDFGGRRRAFVLSECCPLTHSPLLLPFLPPSPSLRVALLRPARRDVVYRETSSSVANRAQPRERERSSAAEGRGGRTRAGSRATRRRSGGSP